MADVVILRNIPTDLNSNTGRQFVTDCTRAAEGLISDKELQEKYELSLVDWQNITKDVALGHAIRAERERRVRNGTAAQESAAALFATAPKVLGTIMHDQYASPRHRIEAAREIRQAAVSTENAPDSSEKFVITINLGSDVERYEKTIAPMKPLLPANKDKIDDGAR